MKLKERHGSLNLLLIAIASLSLLTGLFSLEYAFGGWELLKNSKFSNLISEVKLNNNFNDFQCYSFNENKFASKICGVNLSSNSNTKYFTNYDLEKYFSDFQNCPKGEEPPLTSDFKSNYQCNFMSLNISDSKAWRGNLEVIEVTLANQAILVSTGKLAIQNLILNGAATIIAGGDVEINKIIATSPGALNIVSISGKASVNLIEGQVDLIIRGRTQNTQVDVNVTKIKNLLIGIY